MVQNLRKKSKKNKSTRVGNPNIRKPSGCTAFLWANELGLLRTRKQDMNKISVKKYVQKHAHIACQHNKREKYVTKR